MPKLVEITMLLRRSVEAGYFAGLVCYMLASVS